MSTVQWNIKWMFTRSLQIISCFVIVRKRRWVWREHPP